MDSEIDLTIEDPVPKKLRKLENKLDKILVNQNEIMGLLGKVSMKTIPCTTEDLQSDFFPVKNVDELYELDAALASPISKYVPMMKRVLLPDGTLHPLRKRFHRLFEEEVLLQFNYEGMSGKLAFKDLENVNRTIFEFHKRNGYTEFEYIKEIREAFRLFKNRYYKNKFVEKKKNVTQKTWSCFEEDPE